MARAPAKAATPAEDKGEIAGAKSLIDHDLIRELAKLLDETGLTEIEFERVGQRLRVARRGKPLKAPSRSDVKAESALKQVAESVDLSNHPGLVTSPMVGTAYRGADPNARPFVEVGGRVSAGDPLLIIEAMKTMNRIPAPRAGTVTQILFGDGQPVEFGEPLMIIE